MGESVGKALRKLDQDSRNRACCADGRAVDEDHDVRRTDRFGVFGQQLASSHHRQAVASELLLDRTANAPADSVIAAEGIATRQQQRAPGLVGGVWCRSE